MANDTIGDAVRAALANESLMEPCVGGLICFHDIREKDVNGKAARNRSLFNSLLEPQSQDNVMIATLFWDLLQAKNVGTKTETETKAAYSINSSSETLAVRWTQDPTVDEGIYASIFREFIAMATPSASIDCKLFFNTPPRNQLSILTNKNKQLADLKAKVQASSITHAMEIQQVMTENLQLTKELQKAIQSVDEVTMLKEKLHAFEKLHVDSARWQDHLCWDLICDLATRPGPKGVTALHLAAKCGRADFVEPLVEAGVPLEAKMLYVDGSTDRSYGTALHWASIEGHLGTAKALVAAGADIEAVNTWRRTPLHCAARFGHLEVVKLLVNHNANKEARRDTNETPLHFAVEENHYSVVEYLLDANADINAYGDRGTPLKFAYAKGHYEIVELLVCRGGRM